VIDGIPGASVVLLGSLAAMRRRPLDWRAIVAAVVGLGRSLGVDITAEGIETTQQMELVRRAGCTEGQGYLIGRPRPISELLDFAPLHRVTAAA